MPQLDWDRFSGLPGAATRNFEMLCRSLIRRHYGQYGDFRARAQQPGVEFHLKLHSACPLGDVDRWFGWQCRWYDLPRGRALGTSRQSAIKEAIAKTAELLPNLTDWVLWTKYPLTAGDQQWFYGLDTPMRLQLWAEAELEEHLSGAGEIFLRAYFGDLILTDEDLSQLHQEATAPLAARWQPNLHQTIHAEREIERMLGQADSWDGLRQIVRRLAEGRIAVKSEIEGIPELMSHALYELDRKAESFQLALEGVLDALADWDPDILNEILIDLPSLPKGSLSSAPRRLRSKQHLAGLKATNLLADIRLANDWLRAVANSKATRQIAVVAEYGCGKTFLAAQLSGPQDCRPAGILLHGSNLNAGGSLNFLANTIVIQGVQVPTMESLIAAVDAAGRRAQRRLPIFIDGLNESEDPRNWKGLLASIDETLRRYPYVLVVTTVRPEFVEEILPETVDRLDIPDFGGDADDAIALYFRHFLINPEDAELPYDLLARPLYLRMFCEVTNPDRKREVGVEAMPGTLTALFERYLEGSAVRIAELSPPTNRYYAHDVRSAIARIGTSLWEKHSRSLLLSELRVLLGDENRPWNFSLVRALEQHSILLRVRGHTLDEPRVGIVYDALAGHLIADSLLAQHGSAELPSWLGEPSTAEALAGSLSDRHPLAPDILRAFSGLVPRRYYGQHFWKFVDDPLRSTALRDSADLEGTYIDSETVEQLGYLIANPSGKTRNLFDRLMYTHGSAAHPLNASFLETAIRPMEVADRDITWSEWLRNNDQDIASYLQHLANTWKNRQERDASDRLRAQMVKWVLTSTVRRLRDVATKALYWYGRGSPGDLFEISVDALQINDAYVYERLLATSYGVAISNQSTGEEFCKALGSYLHGLADTLMAPSQISPINSHLARIYVRDTVSFALAFCPQEVPESFRAFDDLEKLPFASGSLARPIPEGDARGEELKRTLGMDFENYTVGRLFDDRRNYDMDHPGLKSAVAYVLGTIWELGWRKDKLGKLDEALRNSRARGELAERYSDKYGWIGFRQYAGMLSQGGVQVERQYVDDRAIDPSFPSELVESILGLPDWTRPTPLDNRRWISSAKITVPHHLLNPTQVDTDNGPWVAAYGYLADEKRDLGREVFGFVTALLVDPGQMDTLVNALREWNHRSSFRIPQLPLGYGAFACEVPWSRHFTTHEDGPYSYSHELLVAPESKIDIELLSHNYIWEGLGSAEYLEAPVPSAWFSGSMGLRGIPQTFNQELSDGTLASKTTGPPNGFSGHLLYLREDLVRDYAKGRRLVWFAWGERSILGLRCEVPKWLSNAYRNQKHVWREAIQHSWTNL